MESESAVDESIESPFELLSHRYRRYAVRVLEDHDCELALADLADETARREYDCPVTEIPAGKISTLYLSLYHSHIPILVDAGVVEYDQERDIVVPRDGVSKLRRVLTEMP